MEVLNPRIVVEGSQRETDRITRGLKKKRENALAFSAWAVIVCQNASQSTYEYYKQISSSEPDV
jgi:hypothetical protein